MDGVRPPAADVESRVSPASRRTTGWSADCASCLRDSAATTRIRRTRAWG